MNENKARVYEELTMNAHPALQTQLFDGWILRFANGYTNRANSINPLYPSYTDLDEKILTCEKLYNAHGLPAVYKITDYTEQRIVRRLEDKGYTLVTPTFLMEMNIDIDTGKSWFPSSDCIINDIIDDEWINCYIAFSKLSDENKISTVKRIFGNVKNPAFYGHVVKNGASAACGSCVIERGYAGLVNIVVEEAKRGNGHGYEICASLLSAAKAYGVHTAYLQVLQTNTVALNLYKKLGFTKLYAYWYMMQPELGN